VVNAAGRGSSPKEYDVLLADDPAYAERAKVFTAKCATCPNCWSSSDRWRRARDGQDASDLVHHSDRGVQYVRPKGGRMPLDNLIQ
jgi:hypothetical protein